MRRKLNEKKEDKAKVESRKIKQTACFELKNKIKSRQTNRIFLKVIVLLSHLIPFRTQK